MPPLGHRKAKPRTEADYTKALELLGAMDRIAGILAREFSDCPRVLLITTTLFDAHKEISERRAHLVQGQQKEGTA